MKTLNQLERIAVQIEMLKLSKPLKQITQPEWDDIVKGALELIYMLGLDKDASDPDDWKMQ